MDYRRFLKLLKQEKLIVRSTDYGVPPFFLLVLPGRSIWIKREPDKVYRVVEIACQLKQYDLCEVILGLYARSNNINDVYLFWNRPESEERRSLISLGDWLIQKGYDISELKIAPNKKK